MQKIYLASTSPRRKQLLKQIGLEFKVCSSNYKEDMTLKMKPTELAKYLSRGKAKAVIKNIKTGLVIAADTFITLDKKVLGKPHTSKQAKITLQSISGKTLKVITGFTVIDASTKKEISKAVTTKVFIKNLKEQEIDNYIKTGEPLDKAGAFGVQGLGVIFVKKIDGDYNNVVGLPLFKLVQVLKEFNVEIFD
ncbi:septum formation inhibitor Maf [Candidatus Parcubacteria bacterium]|nr:septum formation inhibitor Maf [Candidatus Parcubacteria bacterium]